MFGALLREVCLKLVSISIIMTCQSIVEFAVWHNICLQLRIPEQINKCQVFK